MIKQFHWRNIADRFIACLHDERGVAMTEYLIISCIAIPLAAYLLHPDNGLYQAVRQQYNLTSFLLMFPGP